MSIYGCLPPQVDLRDYKVKATQQQCANLPATFELPRYSAVKQQGTVSSCVAHATSSILEWHDKGQHVLSTNFIYGIQNKLFGCDTPGMYLKDACKIIKEYGDMLESDCKGNTEVPFCYSTAEQSFSDKEKLNKAQKFKVFSYYSCLTQNDIKYAVMTYGPVLASIKMYEKYSMDKDGVIIMNTDSEFDYHGIMIYGWNEQGFLIQNSWGKYWGKNGCMILPYSQKICEAKVLIDYKEENEGDIALKVVNTNEILDLLYKSINKIINLIKTVLNNL